MATRRSDHQAINLRVSVLGNRVHFLKRSRIRRHGLLLNRWAAEFLRASRRTFATRLNEKGVGMRTIQRLMGHRYIGTTAVYSEAVDLADLKRRALELT